MCTPVLLLFGGDSPPELGLRIANLEKVLPNPGTVVLPGQQHIAMYMAPDLAGAAGARFPQ
jgi:hypothetical protein